jgi:hypothetical protein
MVLADRDAAAQAHDAFNAHRVDLENPIMVCVCVWWGSEVGSECCARRESGEVRKVAECSEAE